jgi:hypothetical protein
MNGRELIEDCARRIAKACAGVEMPLAEAAVMRESQALAVIERVQRSQVLSVRGNQRQLGAGRLH